MPSPPVRRAAPSFYPSSKASRVHGSEFHSPPSGPPQSRPEPAPRAEPGRDWQFMKSSPPPVVRARLVDATHSASSQLQREQLQRGHLESQLEALKVTRKEASDRSLQLQRHIRTTHHAASRSKAEARALQQQLDEMSSGEQQAAGWVRDLQQIHAALTGSEMVSPER